jgi:gliding motility-associated-like protein
MTILRSIVFLLFCCLLFPALSGQHRDQPFDTTDLSLEQLRILEFMATDSVGTDLQVPNVFTPNGDGINDNFGVTTDGTTVYEFTVFTRTGTRVFHSLSPRVFWDGKNLAGYEVPEGVYYYVLEESGEKDAETNAGFIHLFR